MFTKRMSLITLLVALLLLATPVTAQGPSPQHSDPTWQATYWNNVDLAGTAVLQRAEANIDYNWANSSPAPPSGNSAALSLPRSTRICAASVINSPSELVTQPAGIGFPARSATSTLPRWQMDVAPSKQKG